MLWFMNKWYRRRDGRVAQIVGSKTEKKTFVFKHFDVGEAEHEVDGKACTGLEYIDIVTDATMKDDPVVKAEPGTDLKYRPCACSVCRANSVPEKDGLYVIDAQHNLMCIECDERRIAALKSEEQRKAIEEAETKASLEAVEERRAARKRILEAEKRKKEKEAKK